MMSSRRRSCKSPPTVVPTRSSNHLKVRRILKISVKAVAVRTSPGKVSPVICQLNQGIYVWQVDEIEAESLVWLQIGCGWICSVDGTGAPTYIVSTEAEAHKSWSLEFDNRRKISEAIAALLTRSFGLTDARRLSRSIYNHSKSSAGKKLMNVLDVSIEDLLIGLKASTGLRQNELLDFIRITASQQSNPPQVVEEIAGEVDRLINLRPTVWVKDNLKIIETTDTREKNKRFILAAARGDIKQFQKFLDEGQDLIAIHPNIGYTALHAAADFGCTIIVKELLAAGVSPNIRDTRKAQTPLHFAAQSGRNEICRLLLDKGADRTLPNSDGYLPYQVADEYGHVECREMLKQVPQEIHHISVTETTPRSISLSWQPPVMTESIYAKIIDYVVEWVPIGDPFIVGHGNTFELTTNSFTIAGLMPYTGHGFRVYSRSLAGISPPSSRMIPFTMPCEPDSPSPVEIFKVTTNAIQLAWNPPASTNGRPLDFYQLEIVECDKMGFVVGTHDIRTDITLPSDSESRPENSDSVTEYSGQHWKHGGVEEDSDEEHGHHNKGKRRSKVNEMFDELGTDGGVASRGTAASQADRGPNSAGGPNRSYRLIKHKTLDSLQRDITGLKPNSHYKCRVRCHTELGYSYWSDWCAPVVPSPGVYVIKFNDLDGGGDPSSRQIRLGWFQPSLTGSRKVTAYELQRCVVKGPMHKIIHVSMPAFLRKREPAQASALDFQTIKTELTRNEVDVDGNTSVYFALFVVLTCDEFVGLLAGRNYLFRVRPCIGQEWTDWSLSVQSDIVSVPACRPNPPYDVRVATISEEEDGMNMAAKLNGDHEEDFGSSDNAEAEESEKRHTEEVHGENLIPDIGHNYIVIQWKNGRANGSPVLQFEVEMAHIRAYRDAEIRDDYSEGQKHGKKKSKAHSHEPLLPVLSAPLEWINVTSQGDVLGPTAFRATGLSPGLSYCFRVRQKNKLGFSDFSEASEIYTTWSSTPPGRPYPMEICARFVLLQWTPRSDTLLGSSVGLDLTNLEYDIEIAQLPIQYVSSSPLKRSKPQQDHIGLESELPPVSDYIDQSNNIFPDLASKTAPALIGEQLKWKKADSRPYRVDNTVFESVSPSPYISVIDDKSDENSVESLQLNQAIRQGSKTLSTSTLGATTSDVVSVLIDRLSPSTCYVVRVRARTVAGWSRWSEISQEFKTIDAS